MPCKFIIRVRTADLGHAGRGSPLHLEMSFFCAALDAHVHASTDLKRHRKNFVRDEISEFSLEYKFDAEVVSKIVHIKLKGSDGDHFAFDWLDIRVAETGVNASFLGYRVPKSTGQPAQIWIKGREIKFLPTEMYEYTVRTKTASVHNAGSDSTIWVSFPGALDENAHAKLNKFNLNTAGNDFRFGGIDQFTIKTIFPLSHTIGDGNHAPSHVKLHVHHEGGDAWMLEWIQVEQVNNGHIWSFLPDGAYDELDDSQSVIYDAVDAHFYDVTLKTGVVENAGTDCAVHLTLYDVNGSHTYVLDSPSRNDFERFAKDKFRVMSRDISKVVKVGLSLASGGDKWFVDWVEVKPIADHRGKKAIKPWTFPANRWIEKSAGTVILPEKDMQDVQIISKTGDISNAQSDGNIFIELIGVQGGRQVTSFRMKLDSPGDDFERRNADTFKLRSNVVLDELRAVRVINASNDNWTFDWFQVDLLGAVEATKSYNLPAQRSKSDASGMTLKLNDTIDLTPAPMNSFVFAVKTGAVGSRGGDKVYADLIDDKGRKVSILLDRSGHSDLRNGQVDLYRQKTTTPFGELTSVAFRGANKKWYIDWISVYVDTIDQPHRREEDKVHPIYFYDYIGSTGAIPVKGGQVSSTEQELRDIVKRNCPYLVHHKDEKYHVSSVESYMERPGVTLYDLGENMADIGSDEELSHLPDQGKDWYFKDRDASSGMFRPFSKKDAKVYVHIKALPHSSFVDVQYWYFYPWNGAGRVRINSLIANKPVPRDGFEHSLGDLGEHEGDWEHVTYRVNTSEKDPSAEVKSIFLSQHDGGKWLPPDELEVHDELTGRKRFYSSLNGHAAYAKAGDNVSMHVRQPPGIPGFFSFLSPPAIEVEALNKCNSGKVFDGADSIVVVAAQNVASMANVTPPNWLSFGGRWGHVAYPHKITHPDIPEATLRKAYLQVFVTAAPYFVIFPAWYVLTPVLIPVIWAAVALALYAEYYLMVDPQRLAQPLLDDNFPAAEADGIGPTGPAFKPNWLGSE